MSDTPNLYQSGYNLSTALPFHLLLCGNQSLNSQYHLFKKKKINNFHTREFAINFCQLKGCALTSQQRYLIQPNASVSILGSLEALIESLTDGVNVSIVCNFYIVEPNFWDAS